MKIIAADDEILQLEKLTQTIQAVLPNAYIRAFQRPRELLEFAEKEDISSYSTAFLDLQMPKISGSVVAKALKEKNPNIHIIFVSGFYPYDELENDMNSVGYIMKPITFEKIQREIEGRPGEYRPLNREIHVECFGEFQVFNKDMELVKFRKDKAKEMFAVLIYKRSDVTYEELGDILLPRISGRILRGIQLNSIREAMEKSLQDAGISRIITTKNNTIGIDLYRIDCDYYRYLEWDSTAVNKFRGDFMTQYDWAIWK